MFREIVVSMAFKIKTGSLRTALRWVLEFSDWTNTELSSVLVLVDFISVVCSIFVFTIIILN